MESRVDWPGCGPHLVTQELLTEALLTTFALVGGGEAFKPLRIQVCDVS